MKLKVITTYVEMKTPQGLPSKTVDNFSVEKIELPNPAISHFFFLNVGRPWRWTSRLKWNYEQWEQWLATEGVTTWVGYTQGTPLGYIEMQQAHSEVEITFFGLLPQYIGRGFGGSLLSEAIRIAWSFNPKRVWLHTCTLDHKHALKNYLARGFVAYKQEVAMEEIPEEDDPVWRTPCYYQSLAQAYKAFSQQSAGNHREHQPVNLL